MITDGISSEAKVVLDQKADSDVGEALILHSKRGADLAWLYKKANLSWQQRQKYFKEIYILCEKSFSSADGTDLKNDVKRHIFDTEEICIVPVGEIQKVLKPVSFGVNSIAAFASYNFLKFNNESVIYFSGIVVDPTLQGLNYGSLMIQEIMNNYGIKTAVLRTQSPIMYDSFAKVCNIFPSLLDGKRTPEETKNIAKHVAQKILYMFKYNPELMIEQGTYAKSLYTVEPVSNNSSLDDIFKKKININRGDSMIVVGTIK